MNIDGPVLRVGLDEWEAFAARDWSLERLPAFTAS